MSALGIDLGGTKLSLAVFSQSGELIYRNSIELAGMKGDEVGVLIAQESIRIIHAHHSIRSVGIAVPGIYYHQTGKVWAPNIGGWEDYPLRQNIQRAINIPVTIDSDRACYILGESWMGAAKGCSNAIYLAVGTGIGAGIMIDGKVLRGAHDIGGAIGWMALDQPFDEKYVSCGCFEYHASGEGIPRVARELLAKEKSYKGQLRQKDPATLTAHDIFKAFKQKDELATSVFDICIRFWGMAVANLVSLFNPEKIIMGGGVFGPALQFIPAIKNEARRWSQPISINQVSIESSSLGSDAGLYGAGYLALKGMKETTS